MNLNSNIFDHHNVKCALLTLSHRYNVIDAQKTLEGKTMNNYKKRTADLRFLK